MRNWLRQVLLGCVLVTVPLTPLTASAWLTDAGQVPVRPTLPSAVDLMESALYWMQDMSGVDNPRDPASIVNLMEEQAARYFDFAYMAYLIAGPRYARMDVLERSHFQNRIRDRLFSLLAHQMGMYDVRMPLFRPMTPARTSVGTWRAGGVFYHQDGPTIRLAFDFYLTPRGWRIYDVTTNGMSLVTALRSHYFDRPLLDR